MGLLIEFRFVFLHEGIEWMMFGLFFLQFFQAFLFGLFSFSPLGVTGIMCGLAGMV